MEKEKYVHSVFEAIADNYDAANRRISLGQHTRWKQNTVRELVKSLPHQAVILDVCCGTGDMTEFLREQRPEAEFVGVDFSDNMLKMAGLRFKECSNVRLVKGNAMALEFDDSSFDAAVISFALRNTADYATVLHELFRVVKPGCQVCVTDSFEPENALIHPFYKLYFSQIMPLIGGGKRYREQYRWLSRSTSEFITPGRLIELMTECGGMNIKVRRFLFGACVSVIAVKGN